MNAVTVVDLVLASLMTLGAGFGLTRILKFSRQNYVPKELALSLINLSLRNLFNLGWNSRYHLMTFWNLACTAAILNWHMWFSGTVIVAFYVLIFVTLLRVKSSLLRHNAVAA